MHVATKRRDVGTAFTILFVIAFLLACTTVTASQLTFRIDSNSTLRVVLCLQGICDEQSQPLGGYVTMVFDCDDAPNQARLLDYHLEAAHDFRFHLDYGVFGSVDATAERLIVAH